MILLVTMSLDPHTDLVIDSLREIGALFFRYNTDLSDQYAIEVSLDGGTLLNRKNNKVVQLETVRSVWVRRRTVPNSLKDVVAGYTQYLEEQWKLFTEIILSAINKEALWVNHPLSYEVAKNKLYQLKIAKEVGFSIPSTCITNDPATLSRLVGQQGKVLYKPVSSSIIDGGEKLFTRTLSIQRRYRHKRLLMDSQYLQVFFNRILKSSMNCALWLLVKKYLRRASTPKIAG